jgi:hypothetical protein
MKVLLSFWEEQLPTLFVPSNSGLFVSLPSWGVSMLENIRRQVVLWVQARTGLTGSDPWLLWPSSFLPRMTGWFSCPWRSTVFEVGNRERRRAQLLDNRAREFCDLFFFTPCEAEAEAPLPVFPG